jgi:polyhydroxyalkanoate synthesis regulator phasin
MNGMDSAEEMDRAGRSTAADDEMDFDMGATTSDVGDRAGGAAMRLIFAGVGAVATACDQAASQFDRFVDRGQRVQEQWQDRADEVRRQNLGARGRVRDSFRSAMDVFLNSLNIPSKGDIDTLNVKMNILSRKLDDLQMDRVGEPGPRASEPPPPPPPPADVAT